MRLREMLTIAHYQRCLRVLKDLQRHSPSLSLNVRSERCWGVPLSEFMVHAVAVTLFNGVVQLELQRRQNSAKARALILQMADMMGSLLVGVTSEHEPG